MKILDRKVKEQGWDFINDKVLNEKWFHKHKDSLTNYGRDVELLFTYVKICHGRRIYGKDSSIRKKISSEDLDNGIQMLLANKEQKETSFISSLYV